MDLENNAKLSKNILRLIGIVSNDNICVLFTESKDNVYSILFTNNFRNVIESKKCPIKPSFYAINNEYLIASNGNYIYIIIFKKKNIPKKNKKKEKDKDSESSKSKIMKIINNNIGKSMNPIMSKLDYKSWKK